MAAIGEEAIMADPVEAAGQDMDFVFVDRNKPRIGHCGAMRVAGEISKDLGRTAKGRLGVDHPFGVSQGGDLLGEGALPGERRESAEELEIAVPERCFERGKAQPPEKAREGMNGQEEFCAARDPALSVWRETAAGHHAMDMRMMGQRLAPGVQNGEKPNLGAEL